MSAEAQNKTEQPTSRRLEKAREKGQLPQSEECISAATLIGMVGAVALFGPWFVRWSKAEIRFGLRPDTSVMESSQAFMAFMADQAMEVMFVMMPFILVILLAGVGASLMITGLQFNPGALEWKLENLSPVKGLKNLFSAESLVKLGMSVVKLIFISVLVWFYLRDRLNTLAVFQWVPLDQMLSAVGGLILGVVIRICIGLIVIAAVDLIYRKWKYIDQLKMTKQEVKEERRDTDGAPEVKVRIRRKQYEAAMKRMLQDVPKANVVLVNPTHVAVALRYDPATMQAPVVVAKGGDFMCEKIKDIARSYGVPIIRRPSLAREIFTTVKLGKPIPDRLFTAVAEVLALIYRLRKSR